MRADSMEGADLVVLASHDHRGYTSNVDPAHEPIDWTWQLLYPPHLQPDSSEQFAFFCKAVVRGVCRDINATGFHDVWIGSHETVAKVEGIVGRQLRSEEHTSELQSLMRISYAVFCLKKKKILHILHYKA